MFLWVGWLVVCLFGFVGGGVEAVCVCLLGGFDDCGGGSDFLSLLVIKSEWLLRVSVLIPMDNPRFLKLRARATNIYTEIEGFELPHSGLTGNL